MCASSAENLHFTTAVAFTLTSCRSALYSFLVGSAVVLTSSSKCKGFQLLLVQATPCSQSRPFRAIIEAAAMGTPPAPLKMGLDFLLSGTGDLPSGSHEVPGPPPSVPPPFFEPIPPVDLREPGASQLPHQAQLYQASSSSLVTATGLITPQPRHRCACGSSFNRSLNYLYHIGFGRTSADCDEVDVALYPCVVPGCDSAFRRKTDQAKHHSCVHSKSRPFKCGAATCDSAFFFRKDLHKHIATVRKYKPCRLVSATFFISLVHQFNGRNLTFISRHSFLSLCANIILLLLGFMQT